MAWLTSAVTTASLTVAAVEDPPVAAPETYALSEDTVLTVAAPGVLANDTDADGDPLQATVLAAPTHGSLVLGLDGAVSYTPAPDYHGIDTFSYTVDDGVASDSTTVTLSIAAVNDAPSASPDSASTASATAVTVDVLANDTDVDGDPLTVVAAGPSPDGTVTIIANRVRFAPNPGFSGSATFSYTASDGQATDLGTVTVSVAPPPPPPTPTPTPTATPAPTSPPTATPEPPTATPSASVPPPPPSASPSSEVASTSPSPSPSASSPSPSPTVTPPSPSPSPPGGGSSDPLQPLAQPQLTTAGFGGADAAGFGDAFGGLGGGFGLAVSAALLGIPGLLFLLAVGGQLLGAAAWIPAIRRQLAGVGIRRRDRSDEGQTNRG